MCLSRLISVALLLSVAPTFSSSWAQTVSASSNPKPVRPPSPIVVLATDEQAARESSVEPTRMAAIVELWSVPGAWSLGGPSVATSSRHGEVAATPKPTFAATDPCCSAAAVPSLQSRSTGFVPETAPDAAKEPSLLGSTPFLLAARTWAPHASPLAFLPAVAAHDNSKAAGEAANTVTPLTTVVPNKEYIRLSGRIVAIENH
jgi:hypothetical protein